jgi:hypothetical protein
LSIESSTPLGFIEPGGQLPARALS